MKRRVFRMVVLFWLVWYISGPVCEFFDFWDPPQQEVHDVLFYAGGGITLVAVGFAFTLAVQRKFRERWARANAADRHRPSTTPLSRTPVAFYALPITSIHSPPLPLRI
ncbi:MAG: hypothetical protein ACRD1J_11340 [Terriglobia bacterium]